LLSIVIKPDSEEAKALPALEVQKRLRAWQEKKIKLANPNFSVSKSLLLFSWRWFDLFSYYGFRTRLAVRGLPKDFTEADLKEVFRKAAIDPEKPMKRPPAIKQVFILLLR
jgi:hypothetical protein